MLLFQYIVDDSSHLYNAFDNKTLKVKESCCRILSQNASDLNKKKVKCRFLSHAYTYPTCDEAHIWRVDSGLTDLESVQQRTNRRAMTD